MPMETMQWGDSRGDRWRRIRVCPACGEPIGGNMNVAAHIATHDPEDFGLSPLGSAGDDADADADAAAEGGQGPG